MKHYSSVQIAITLLLLLAVQSGSLWSQSTNANSRPNILFIAIDDMNDWAGFLDTHPQVQTPHMDALAEAGISFTNAHCPAPLCGPSRSAIMSGRWPTSTGVYTNHINYRTKFSGQVSVPEYFRQQGYYAMGVGKIFHAGVDKMPINAFDEYGGKGISASPFSSKDLQTALQTPFHKVTKQGKEFSFPLNGIPADRHWGKSHTFDWGAIDLPDSLFGDTRSTNWAMEKLKENHQKPFFLAVGFTRPHQPLFNPKRFHDQYPLESLVLPPVIEGDLQDVPRAASEYARAATTSGLHKSVAAYGEWPHAVSSYLAAISYVDDLIGNLMQALEASEYADNTLVIVWSDHGWHLGEKEHWGKGTGWYRSTRIPLLIIPPRTQEPSGFTAHSVSNRPVNLIDLGPTMAEMAGIPLRPEWEGKSLLPLLQNPDTKWQAYTHTTFAVGNHSITTERWQYLHYFDGTTELYDLLRDPNEFVNLANQPEYAAIQAQLHSWLPKEPNWKHMIRYHNFKALVPADGSRISLYNHAYQNQVEGNNNVAADYPKVVNHIENWIQRTQPTAQYLSIAD